METNIFARTINNMINQRLLDLHTGFLGRIEELDINMAKVQVLTMYKAYGEKAKTQAPLTDVPVLFPYKYIYVVDEETLELKEIKQEAFGVGDVVLCLCCERDITQAKEGQLAAPSVGRHHSLSDAVIIAAMSEVVYEGGE